VTKEFLSKTAFI